MELALGPRPGVRVPAPHPLPSGDFRAIRAEGPRPLTVLIAVLVVALVHTAVGPGVRPLAVLLAVLVVALVHVAVGPGVRPLAVRLAVLVVALVDGAVGPSVHPDAVRRVAGQRALVTADCACVCASQNIMWGWWC